MKKVFTEFTHLLQVMKWESQAEVKAKKAAKKLTFKGADE